jgi:hypothetical protein
MSKPAPVRNEPPASARVHEPGASATGTNQRPIAKSSSSTDGTPGPETRNPNPETRPSGYHLVNWCLWEVIERCTKDSCDACPLADDCAGLAKNARGFLRIDDAIAIKARSSRAAWETEMLCQGAQRDWLVLPEFDLARHVAPVRYNPAWPLYRAIDFGFTNPLVCLWLQVTPAGCVHVIQEYSAARVALEQHADEIKRQGPDKGVAATYVDPAGNSMESNGKSCTEILLSKGIQCTSRKSSIVEGLELIRAALAPAGPSDAPPRLLISPKCEKLIDAFQAYHFPPPESAHDHSTPVKDGPDHFIDALRYFFVNRMRPDQKTSSKKY